MILSVLLSPSALHSVLHPHVLNQLLYTESTECLTTYVTTVPGKAYVFLPFVLFEVAGDYANPTVIVDQHSTIDTETPHCAASSTQGIGTRAERMLGWYQMGICFASLKPHSLQFDLENFWKSYSF